MYSIDYVFNQYIPARVKYLWAKYRKFYGGDRDDLEQSARLAVWQWVQAKGYDQEKLTEFEPIVDAAIVAETKANTKRGVWGEWPEVTDDESGERRLAILAETLKSSPLGNEQLALLRTFRSRVRDSLSDPFLADLLWDRFVYGDSWERLTQRLLTHRNFRDRNVTVEYTQLVVDSLADEVREKLAEDGKLLDRISRMRDEKGDW